MTKRKPPPEPVGVCGTCGPSPLDDWDVLGANDRLGPGDDVDDSDGVTRGFCPVCRDAVPLVIERKGA